MDFNPLVGLDMIQDEWMGRLASSGSWRNLDRIELSLGEITMLIDALASMPHSGSDLLKNPALPEFSAVIDTVPHTWVNVVSFKKTVLQQKEFIENMKGLTMISTPILDAFFYSDHHRKEPDATISIGCSKLIRDGKTLHTSYSSLLVKNHPALDMLLTDAGDPADLQEHARDMKLLYMAVQYALRHRPTVFSVSTENVVVKTPRKHGGKSRRKIKAVRVLRINPNHLLPESHEPRKIGCPCWGVMGHYRTTKSNKQVWVKPHRKGKHRDNPNAYQSKQYVIQTGEMQ